MDVDNNAENGESICTRDYDAAIQMSGELEKQVAEMVLFQTARSTFPSVRIDKADAVFVTSVKSRLAALRSAFLDCNIG